MNAYRYDTAGRLLPCPDAGGRLLVQDDMPVAQVLVRHLLRITTTRPDNFALRADGRRIREEITEVLLYLPENFGLNDRLIRDVEAALSRDRGGT